VGLTGLFERASLLNGLLTIDSIPGLGTHIFVRLPLEKKVVEALK